MGRPFCSENQLFELSKRDGSVSVLSLSMIRIRRGGKVGWAGRVEISDS
jgi:hypothetical protein